MADIPYDKQHPYRGAGNGGRGSFSYADTTVYGPRGTRITVAIPIGNPIMGGHSGSFPGALVPGGGGGAKANRKKELLRGSRAVGAGPHGIVIIRLTRVT